MNSFLSDLTSSSLRTEFPAEAEHLAYLSSLLDDLRKASKYVRSFVSDLSLQHEQYGKAVVKSARSFGQVLSKGAGSASRYLLEALRHFATHYETVGTLYTQQSSELVLSSTDSGDELLTLRKRIVEDLQTCIKETSLAKSTCIKAKSRYERTCKELTATQEGLEKMKNQPGSLYQVTALQRSEDKVALALEVQQQAETALDDCLETVKIKQVMLTESLKTHTESVQAAERKVLEASVQLLGGFLQLCESAAQTRAEMVTDDSEKLSALTLDLLDVPDGPATSLTMAEVLNRKIDRHSAAVDERKNMLKALKTLIGELVITEDATGKGIGKVLNAYTSLSPYLTSKTRFKEVWFLATKAIEVLTGLHINRCKTLSQHCVAALTGSITSISQLQKDAVVQCAKTIKDHLSLEDECLKGFERAKKGVDDSTLQQLSQTFSEKMQQSAERTEKQVQGLLSDLANQEGKNLQGAKKVLVTLNSLEGECGASMLQRTIANISTTEVWRDVEAASAPLQRECMSLDQIKGEISPKFTPRLTELEDYVDTEIHRSPEKEGSPLSKFNLPPESLVVESFSCALVKKIMLQGRLYLSTTHVCFHSYFNSSTIFGRDTVFVVPINEILRVEKRTYAFLFDNAIAVITKEFELLLASFLARDQALSVLTSLMQLHPEAVPQSSNDITLDSPADSRLKLTKRLRWGRPERSSLENAMQKLPPDSFFKYPIITRMCFNSSVTETFAALFESSELWSRYYGARGDSDVVMTVWSPSPPEVFGGKSVVWPTSSSRDHKFTHPVKVRAPLIPSSCTCHEEYEAFWLSETQVLMEVIVHVDSVPFSDYFSTRCRWILEQEDTNTYLSLWYGMNFHKSTWFQSRIEKSGVDEFTENVQTHWIPLAKQIWQGRQQSTERLPPPQVIIKEVRVETQLHWLIWLSLFLVLVLWVQVWRLQRRIGTLEGQCQ